MTARARVIHAMRFCGSFIYCKLTLPSKEYLCSLTAWGIKSSSTHLNRPAKWGYRSVLPKLYLRLPMSIVMCLLRQARVLKELRKDSPSTHLRLIGHWSFQKKRQEEYREREMFQQTVLSFSPALTRSMSRRWVMTCSL